MGNILSFLFPKNEPAALEQVAVSEPVPAKEAVEIPEAEIKTSLEEVPVKVEDNNIPKVENIGSIENAEVVEAAEVSAAIPKEPTPEIVNELVKEPVKEVTPEPLPVKELTPELLPVKALIPEPLPVEKIPEPIEEPTPGSFCGVVDAPLKEPTPEPIEETRPASFCGVKDAPLNEPTPDPIKEINTPGVITGAEALKETLTQTVVEDCSAQVKETIPEPIKEVEPIGTIDEVKPTKEPELVKEVTPEAEEPSPIAEAVADVITEAAETIEELVETKTSEESVEITTPEPSKEAPSGGAAVLMDFLEKSDKEDTPEPAKDSSPSLVDNKLTEPAISTAVTPDSIKEDNQESEVTSPVIESIVDAIEEAASAVVPEVENLSVTPEPSSTPSIAEVPKANGVEVIGSIADEEENETPIEASKSKTVEEISGAAALKNKLEDTQ